MFFLYGFIFTFGTLYAEKNDTGCLGVYVDNLSDLSSSMIIYLGIGEDMKGVMVSSFEKNSPAYDSGIKKYDIITKLNDFEINDLNQFLRIVKRLPYLLKNFLYE